MNIYMPIKIRRFWNQFLVMILISVLFNVNIFAQETDTIIPIKKNAEEILKNINLNSDGFNFWKDNFSGHWSGIDLGFNTFLNPDYSDYDSEFMENDMARSFSLHLNIFKQSIGLQRNRNNFGLVTGIGVQYNQYRLDDYITIEKAEDNIIVPVEFDLGENQKSTLSMFAVTVPLLAEIQIPINNYRNRLYFSSGMYFSYRISSYTRIKYKTEQIHRQRITGNYSLQNFKYGLMVRTGYRWINFFAMYQLSPFFKEGKGPELTPFTVGITLIRF